MHRWRRIGLWLLPFGVALADSEPGIPVHYLGGSLNACAPKSKARLYLPSPESFLFRCGAGEVSVPYLKVTRIEYGQDLRRRYGAAASTLLVPPLWPASAVLLLNKSRRHVVTFEYTDDGGKPQSLVIRVEKDNIRALLADLSARTGRPVEYQDRDARKPKKDQGRSGDGAKK